MRILFDIGHPAHVHYFKNTIKKLESKHKVVVVARKRDIIFRLLDTYAIKYKSRGKGAKGMLGKFIYIFFADLYFLFLFLKYKIDISISFSTGYPAHISFLLKKYAISINDTEHANHTHQKFVYPFSNLVLTPYVYYEKVGDKQFKFNNLVEGFYLHDSLFKPDKKVLNTLGITKDEKIALVRFITWDAHHDYGVKGFAKNYKIKLVNSLVDKGYKVFISAEGDSIPNELLDYKLTLPVEKIHSFIYYCNLFISESGTMASESAYLGTHVIYTNPLPLMGYLREAQKYELLYHFTEEEKIFEKIDELSLQQDLFDKGKEKAGIMKKKFINPTAFLCWLIDNYPQSIEKISNNQVDQDDFK